MGRRAFLTAGLLALVAFFMLTNSAGAQELAPVVSVEQVEDGLWVTVVIPSNLEIHSGERVWVEVEQSPPGPPDQSGRYIEDLGAGRSVRAGIRWDWRLRPRVRVTAYFRDQEIFSQDLVSPYPSVPQLHVVWPGDTLWEIAQHYDKYGRQSTWQQICSWNELADCNYIQVGQILQIPPGVWPSGLFSRHEVWVTPTLFLVGPAQREDVDQVDIFVNSKFKRRYVEEGLDVEGPPVVTELEPEKCLLLSARVRWQNRRVGWGGTRLCFAGFPGRELTDVFAVQISEKGSIWIRRIGASTSPP